MSIYIHISTLTWPKYTYVH
ncbi:hypothetical protein F383_20796 [Gossypium arboreum]|uniref:Uncharacterized protein n=1 Tax=Gossypium arboreum TaxID=29729 RepID=A0A0B0P008_GOSAR|nr:hypothetical protein F383_20796 [Gossypium arboreum]